MPSMGSAPELTLQYKRPCGKIATSMLKASSSPVGVGMDDEMQKLQQRLKALEEERLKIEAFKRELPFCMELLNDAIEASQEHLANYGSYPERTKYCIKEGESVPTSNHKPVLEEFIPVKKTCTEESEEIELKSRAKGDRTDWMSSAQLWSQNGDTKENTARQAQSLMPLDAKQRVGGAFHPFSRDREEITPRCSAQRGLPDLGLSSGEAEEADRDGGLNNNKRCNEAGDQKEGCIVPCNRNSNTSTTDSHTFQQPGQTQRKARRCWSPELHRRFVSALQQLGGSQVATPKQIRELMKVDGLTNDEVKSHLQKYRLHTRRLPSSSCHQSVGTVTQAPQLVVLGGIWVPPHHGHAAPELYTALPNITTQSHAARFYHQRPAPIDGNPLQEFCTSHNINHVESSSQPQSTGSPESSSSMSMEANQDGKSGQSIHGSWKEIDNGAQSIMARLGRAPQLSVALEEGRDRAVPTQTTLRI